MRVYIGIMFVGERCPTVEVLLFSHVLAYIKNQYWLYNKVGTVWCF